MDAGFACLLVALIILTLAFICTSFHACGHQASLIHALVISFTLVLVTVCGIAGATLHSPCDTGPYFLIFPFSISFITLLVLGCCASRLDAVHNAIILLSLTLVATCGIAEVAIYCRLCA
jgi:uncharacterized membrane protein